MSLQTWAYNTRFIMRKKLWLISLIFLAFLFILPISIGIQLQHYSFSLSELPSAQLMARAETLMSSLFGAGSAVMLFFICLCAFVVAMGFFNWMHKKSRIDLQHSLPVSRQGIFAANFSAGSLAVILPVLANIILALIVVSAMGFGAAIPWAVLLGGLLRHLLFFLLIYLVCISAVCLSGNSIVSGLLSMIFLGFAPVAIALYQGLRLIFQPTWYSLLVDWDLIFAYSSPVARYLQSAINSNLALSTWELVLSFAVAIALYFLAAFIYRRRPSEAAGRALAFPGSRAFIKYPLVLLAMVFGAWFFNEISAINDNWFWYFLGAALLGFIAAQLMEIVYAADFRAIGKRLLPLVLLFALFAGSSGLLIADVAGYNSYLPQEQEIAEIEIKLSELNEYTSSRYSDNMVLLNYSDSTRGRDNFDYTDFETLSGEEALLARGKISSEEGIASALSLISKIMQQADNGQDRYAPLPESKYYYNHPKTTTASVRYTLKNGRQISRSYNTSGWINISEIREEIAEIYADEDYRQHIYMLFSFPDEQIRVQSVISYERYQQQSYAYQADSNILGLLNEDIDQLLDVYRTELQQLDAEQMLRELPIGAINFRAYALDPGQISFDSPAYRYYSFSYPVYASFSGSLARLADLGISEDMWLPDYENITSVEVYTFAGYRAEAALPYPQPADIAAEKYYTTESYGYGEETVERYSDPADIRRLIESSYDENCFHMNSLIEPSYTQRYLISYRNVVDGIDYSTRYPKN
jgi:ABC-2 type transport system permease protein